MSNRFTVIQKLGDTQQPQQQSGRFEIIQKIDNSNKALSFSKKSSLPTVDEMTQSTSNELKNLKNVSQSGSGVLSGGFKSYVQGNPIPSANPTPSIDQRKNAAEDYAKQATAGDGFEKYSLDELEKEVNRLKAEAETNGENKFQVFLNDIMGMNGYRREYEAAKKAYDNRKMAYFNYETSRKYGTENAEEAIELLKEKKKNTSDKFLKDIYDSEIKELRQKLYGDGSVVRHVGNIVSSGVNSWVKAGNATMNFTLGNVAKFLGFKNNIFQQGYDEAKANSEEANRRMTLSAKQLGDDNNLSGEAGSALTNAVLDLAPTVIMAMATGGNSIPSSVANLGLGARSASLLTAAQTGVRQIAKNPVFYTSFAGELGNNYYEALDSGATEAEATVAAMTSSIINAMIEVGGIQELPKSLMTNKNFGKKALDFVLDALSEGKEEVLQDFISQITAKAFYDGDKEVLSFDNQEAVINPGRMAKEFGLGTLAGGILGGGMLTFNSIASANTVSEYKKTGEAARKLKDVDGIINYAKHSLNEEIRALANDSNPKSISDLELGQLYAYACRDIDGAISSPTDLNTAIDNYNEIASSTDSKAINGIALSRLTERINSENLDSEVANNIIESVSQNNLDSESAENVEGTEKADNANDSVLHEPERADIAEKLDTDDKYKTKENGYQVKNSRQRHIERVSNKLGAKITWSEDVKRGKYIPSERRIVLNPNMKTSEMYNFVFKHEFTHFLEGKQGYTDFKNYVFEKSALFEKWARERLAKNGIDSTGSREEVIKRLSQVQYEAYRNSDELSKVMRDRFSMNDAEAEVLADFVGENLLGTGDRLEQTLYELGSLEKKHRGIIQRIRDFISDLIARYRNERRFGGLVKDLEYLNDRLKRVAESSDKKISDTKTEKYSIVDRKITMNMTDDERAELLNNTVIKLAEYDGKSDDLNGKNVLLLKSSYNSQACKILKSLGEKFGVFKTYNNQNVSLDFDYSRGSLNESVHKQGNISTDFYDFAKMLYVFDEVVKNAVPIEVHTDKYKGTSRENTNLKSDYVLLSAFRDDNYIVPVEFHLKEMHTGSGQENKLYVSVTLGKIKMEDKVKVAVSDENHQTKDTNLSSAISIPDLISKVNPEYGDFYKYLPESMLNKQQNNSRKTAVNDENYRLKVMRGEDVTEMLAEKAKEKGYSKDDSWKMDHKAPNSQDGYSNSMDNIDKSYGSDGSIYSQQAVYYYGEGREYDNKAISIIKSAKNNPEKMIKIYRAVPNSIKDTRVRNGDWVAIVKEYAIEHGGRVLDDDFRIIENTVPAKHLFSNGDSINEWGYDNGNANEVYKNSENNVKILDVTYDDNGKIIPLSERFNDKNADIKHSITVLPADELLDKYDRGEITREEYLKQTDSMTRRAALQYVQKWEQENGAILKNQRRLDEEREKAVELEREEQQMRKDRESNIGAIRRTVRKLDHALRANTNAKHIPEAYKNVVGNFCKLFADNDQATFEHKELADIYSYYSSLKGDESNADAPQYDPYIDELLKSLVDTLSGKKLTELNSLELNQVRTITDALNYTLDHEEQVFIDGKKAKYEEVGRAALNDIESAEPVKLFGALKKESAEKIREFFYEGNMLPEYFLKRMGGTFEKAFRGLADGQNKWARNMEISRKFVEDVKSKYDYDEWKDTTVSFRTESGANVEITIDQAMQLVATAQRERSNNGQRAKHLSIGGVVIDTEAINKAMKKQAKSKEDISAAWDSLSNRAIQITFEDVDVVSKMLTDAQKGYIKDFVDFLSTQCAVWGNEVTMEQYGYRQFNESNYFPYVSSELFLTKDPAKAESTILRRASFTHSLQKNANNPLVLTSFTDIALQHMESMCNFNAMTVPLETLNKIFNYKTESGEGTAPRSVKAEMKNVLGSGAVDYMQNLIKDLNTGVRGDQRDSFLNRMTSLFKKNAVLANLSVIFQQPTAIIRAGSDMKGKYFTKAAKYYSKNNYEECKQYAPVAVIKQMGRFDTGVGVKNTTWLSGEQTFREKADDFLGWGAGKADEIAWSYLWSAVKAEIADTTDLKVGSEEFLTKAGERFTELVNKTQVYDSVLTKSQNMRNKGLVGSITSFMSEPTVALNMVVNSFLDFKEGKTSGKKFSRIVMSVVTAEIVTAVMQSFITAARDDDEDKSYLEKYLKNVVSNSLSNFNLAGKIPYIRDIMSLWEGYDIERQDISAVSDLIEAFQTLTNENKTVPEKIRRISEALSALFGVPLKNIDRDIAAIAKTIYGFAFGKEKTDAEGLKISALEGVSENNILKPFGIEFFNFSKTGEYERMAEAAKRGDEKTYSESYNRLIENGTEDSDIRTGITKQFKNDKSVKKQSEQYVKELKQNDTFNSFTDEDKEKLTGQVSSALAKEAMVKATEHEPDEYDKLYELYRTNKSGYNKRKKEMLAEGKTEKQINDGLELAKYAYLQSKGIDLHEYLLYKMATSEKYADEDDSSGVSKAEKKKAVDNMDVDEKTRQQIRSYLINGD